MSEAESVLERLPDDAVVVRFGLMAPGDLSLGAQTQFDTDGFYALSVCSAPGMTADELAVAAGLTHSMIRESTVGRLRAVGYDVVSSPGPPNHADLLLPEPPGDADWEALDRVFDAARPNPARIRAADA